MNGKSVLGGLVAGLSMLFSGVLHAETGVTDNVIVVGQSAPLSGPSMELGNEMKFGIQLYFDQINAQGGYSVESWNCVR